ncbi:hypothetical protein WICMUC_005504 [Wickerhamomyces mucosus]|uniref:Ribosomal protein S21 n=1 Tax=Wickerhamomyces mucosus TaxID=1378264 RepID=A0A9P8P8C2_9ASCO|nr:hypothetical protein WICMUC_005504 [Wickerhamomyces mucosus]
MFGLLQKHTATPRAALRLVSSPLGFTRFQSTTEAIFNAVKGDSKSQSKLQDLKIQTSQNTGSLLIKATVDEQHPKDIAQQLKRTGPIAGRTVNVVNYDLNAAFKRLRQLVNSNNIRGEKMAQRFYKKPGKILEEKRIRRKKRIFNEGVRRLMGVVNEAKRRGY